MNVLNIIQTTVVVKLCILSVQNFKANLILRFEIVAKPHVSRMFQFISCVVILRVYFSATSLVILFSLINIGSIFVHNKSKCRTKASSLYFFLYFKQRKYWYLVYDKFHSVIFIMLFLDKKTIILISITSQLIPKYWTIFFLFLAPFFLVAYFAYWFSLDNKGTK